MDDWDTVTVIRKKNTGPHTIKSQTSLNQAMRTGQPLATEKKYHAGHNPKAGHPATDLNTARLDRETEELKHKTVSVDVGKAIQRARTDLKMTQKDVAVKINEKPQIVQEYETSKAIPNQQVLAKLERALGVKLRGKDIGQPLAPRGGAK